MTDYKQREEECLRLARLSSKAEDWGHFVEMAKTWELLAGQQQDRLRWKTTALADRFRNVLFLSDGNKSGQAHSHENADAI
jgi:hypothetical protein